MKHPAFWPQPWSFLSAVTLGLLIGGGPLIVAVLIWGLTA